jgi:hypothetical protein
MGSGRSLLYEIQSKDLRKIGKIIALPAIYDN